MWTYDLKILGETEAQRDLLQLRSHCSLWQMGKVEGQGQSLVLSMVRSPGQRLGVKVGGARGGHQGLGVSHCAVLRANMV